MKHVRYPWGEAIRYWLRQTGRSQADLWRGINDRRHAAGVARAVQLRTINRIANGHHTQTRLLVEIAEELGQPLEAILVSPEQQVAAHERRQLIQDVTEQVVRLLQPLPMPAPPPPVAPPPPPRPRRRRRQKR